MFHDSLTFYIQDIDTTVCNQKDFNEVVNHYQAVRAKPFTCKFILISGGDRETNIPNDNFDKILMLWTYQYLKDPQAIISDLKLKLKDDSIIYIVNPVVDIESGEGLTLAYGWNASPIERQISDIIDCDFEHVILSRNYERGDSPYIMVFLKGNLIN